MTEPRAAPRRLAGLVVSRGIDQGVLGIASLLLAARLGPSDFAPIGVLFVMNSLAIQLSDFGVGFRLLGSAPDEKLDIRGLHRVRAANLGIAVVAVATGLVVGDEVGAVIGCSGVVWLLSAEAYVCKAATLKEVGTRPVVVAEILSSAAFAIGVVGVAVALAGPLAMAAVFIVKHVIEVVATRGGLRRFTPDGAPVGSSAEWFGQVLTYVIANVDFLAISLLLGPTDLSRYLIGFRLASAAPSLLAAPLTQTTFLHLAGTSGDEAQAVTDRVVGRVLRLGVVGTAVGLVAAVIIPPLLGDGWGGTGPVTAILSLAIPWRMLLGVTVAMALTAQSARSVVRWEAMRLAAMTVLVIAAATISIVAVAAVVAAGAVVGIALEHRSAIRLLGLHSWRWLVPSTVAILAVIAVVAVALAE